eukprot:252854_1
MSIITQFDGESDHTALVSHIPHECCDNLGVAVLDSLMKYYPAYWYQYRNGKCNWIASVFAISSSLVSIAFTISLVASLFYTDEETYRQKAHQEGLPYSFIIFFAHLSLAVIDKLICAYYSVKFDNSGYLDLDNRQSNNEEKKYVTIRMIVCILTWFLMFCADCYLALKFPDWPYFGWDMPWIFLLVSFHLTYHLPAILEQNTMTTDVLEEICYLNHICETFTGFRNNNTDDLSILDDYNSKCNQFEKKRKLIQFRNYIVLAYTTTDILLISLYIIEPMFTVSFLGYGLYIGFHTLYSAIPFMDFMVTGSRFASKYDETIETAMELEHLNNKLHLYRTEQPQKPMYFYLFFQRVSCVGLAITICWF